MYNQAERISKETDIINAYFESKLQNSKKASLDFLKRAGILNKNGKPTKQYRDVICTIQGKV
jgi:hypothetical protein